MIPSRIAERKLRDREARRGQIISAARRIAETEGWPHVTVRRLSDEISYSQPVLYAHFGSREGILSAVAIEGFQELGVALEKAQKRAKADGAVEAFASAYLAFASSSPALYEVMFSLSLNVPSQTLRLLLSCDSPLSNSWNCLGAKARSLSFCPKCFGPASTDSPSSPEPNDFRAAARKSASRLLSSSLIAALNGLHGCRINTFCFVRWRVIQRRSFASGAPSIRLSSVGRDGSSTKQPTI